MRDLLDEFLEEFRRREAIARGEDPDADAPRRAKPVGPDPDGEGPPPARRTTPGRRRPRRSRSWWAIGLVVLALILLIAFGIDLWTEALWFQSVRFDAVFWTRFTAQLGLFLKLRRSARSRSSSSTWRSLRVSRKAPATVAARSATCSSAREAAANSGRGGARSNAGAPRPVTFDRRSSPI